MLTPNEFQYLAQKVFVLYDEAENILLNKIAKSAYKGTATINKDSWYGYKLSEFKHVKKSIKKEVDKLVNTRKNLQMSMITQAYSGGKKAFVKEMLQTPYDNKLLPANMKKIFDIFKELNDRSNAADRLILRKANDIYADVVANAAAMTATGSITLREAVHRELKQFAYKGITSYVDKGGRKWSMAVYAEMATITTLNRATRAGYIDTMQEFGYELAYVSSHFGSCPLCIDWEGQILSVTGEDKRYPSLDDAYAAGLFHPNCKHHINTYYDGISKPKLPTKEDEYKNIQEYNLRAKQRYYERQIRRFKKMMAVSSTPKDESEAFDRVQAYRAKIRKNLIGRNAPRKYYREGGTQNLSAGAKKYRNRNRKTK